MYAIALVLTSLLAIGANAQSSSSSASLPIPSLDTCTANCLNQAIAAGECGSL